MTATASAPIGKYQVSVARPTTRVLTSIALLTIMRSEVRRAPSSAVKRRIRSALL